MKPLRRPSYAGRPGMLADIAVFDTKLVEAGNDDPPALLNAEVLYTIVGGNIVYQRQTGHSTCTENTR